MEGKIKELESKVDVLLEILKSHEETRNNNAIILDNNFEILNQKIDFLKSKLTILHIDTQQNFDDVKLELVKIQKTTGYKDVYDNMHVVKGKKA